jgi:hypothetical protein
MCLFLRWVILKTIYSGLKARGRVNGLFWVLILVFGLSSRSAFSAVVINEIHYNGETNTAANEFVELVNTVSQAVDISGWSFSDGVDFTFAPGTEIPGHGYVVVAQRPLSIMSEFGVTALGPYQGALSSQGERVSLEDSSGSLVDEVTYQSTFPWPIAADGTGASMELIDPALDNDLAGSWRSAGIDSDPVEEVIFVPIADAEWSYREGRSEASSPVDAWRQASFVEDNLWMTARTPIGYGDGDDNTVINMRNLFSTLYLRNTFTVGRSAIPSELLLRVYVDDGAVVWINGIEVARVSVPSGHLAFNDFGINHEATWTDVIIANPRSVLTRGLNVLAIHALNTTPNSSDFSIDAELRTPRTGTAPLTPTPGRINSMRTDNAPPQIRQVNHVPQQPRAGQATTITAKVTDPEGVSSVLLSYQVVVPGAYVPALKAKSTNALKANPKAPRQPNPAYEDGWVSVPMQDNGLEGDAFKGDNLYTCVLPGLSHRTLVRYRITVADTLGSTVRVPYVDDECLNFAYFVYNGVPEYVAASRSVLGNGHRYSSEVMTSVPVYHLIATPEDFDQAVAYNGSDQISRGNYDARKAYNWSGTFVHEGQVYDNIGYRLRQRNARYSGRGKRSFKYRFNRGHYPHFRDMQGQYYPTPWEKLSTHKLTGSRGNVYWGLDQAANHVLWNLYGTPASFTHWFQMRVIKQADEVSSGSQGQYFGDFYGLMLAMEEYDVRFLESHNLEKGNIYKLLSGVTNGLDVRKYLAQNAVDDGSDFSNILYKLRPERSDVWLDQHVNYDEWYRYHAVVDAVRHYDVQPNLSEHLKNRFYYFEPSASTPLGRLWLMPWDSDTSWGPNWNGGEDLCKQAIFGYNGNSPRVEFVREYQNVVRELRDLAWTEEQIDLLIDPLAAMIADLVPADRDRWTSAPSAAGSQNDPSLESRVAAMKRFAFTGGNWTGGNDSQQMSISRDSGVSGKQGRDAYLDLLTYDLLTPDTPDILDAGDPKHPTNQLIFQTLDYTGINAFAAWKWRIAEVTLTDELPLTPGDKPKLEIAATWESDEISDRQQHTVTIPPHVARVGTRYRVRARVKDVTGRWSHWSAPIQFVAGEPDTAETLQANLKLTELMFNSPAGNEFDFVEWHNASPTVSLNLEGVTFAAGIDYTFPAGTMIEPMGYLVLVKANDFTVFREYYGLTEDVLLAGPYAQNLANSGENVALLTSAGGTDIVSFTYQDGQGWPAAADGLGYSLIPLVLEDQTEGTLNEGGNWRASAQINGSPGGPDL